MSEVLALRKINSGVKKYLRKNIESQQNKIKNVDKDEEFTEIYNPEENNN